MPEKNTSRDRYAKAAAANNAPFIPDFDIMHVAAKFPKTKSQLWLQERLGSAITERRQLLRYARDHHDKIAPPPPPLLANFVKGAETHDVQAKVSVASSHTSKGGLSAGDTLAQTTASTLQELEIPPNMSYDLDAGLDDTQSQVTSFVSSRASDEQLDKLRVVSLREMQESGVEFECPYCKGVVRARKIRSWKKHVFQDLRAYVCTFEECTAGLFEDKQSWFQHELEYHRRQWFCPLCSDATFVSSSGLRNHLKNDHSFQEGLDVSLNAAVQASSRPVTQIPASSCPLCYKWDESLRTEARDRSIDIPEAHDVMTPLVQFRDHLGSHQEQLALFAITPIFQRDTDSVDASRKPSASLDEQHILNYVLGSKDEVPEKEHLNDDQWVDDLRIRKSSSEGFAEAELAGKQLPEEQFQTTGLSQNANSEMDDTPPLIKEYLDRHREISIYLDRLEELDYNHQEGLVYREFTQDRGDQLEISDEEYDRNYQDRREQLERDLNNTSDILNDLSIRCEQAGLDPELYRQSAALSSDVDLTSNEPSSKGFLEVDLIGKQSPNESPEESASSEEFPPLIAEYNEGLEDISAYIERLRDIDSDYREGLVYRDFRKDRGDQLEISDEEYDRNYQDMREQIERELNNVRREVEILSERCKQAGLNVDSFSSAKKISGRTYRDILDWVSADIEDTP